MVLNFFGSVVLRTELKPQGLSVNGGVRGTLYLFLLREESNHEH